MKGIGLMGKLMIFLLAPLILAFAVGAYFTLRQMVDLGNVITDESLKMVTSIAEKEVVEHARAVATQVELYLASHPELKEGDFNADAEFKRIAVQRVGLTMRGFTSLHALPGEDRVWRYWAHIDPKIVGADMRTLDEMMGEAFDGFWKIIQEGKDGNISSGRYRWRDDEGKPRDYFMVCAPVRGTRYYVASTTYLDEATVGVVPLPMSQVYRDYLEMICWPQENEWWKKRY